MDKQGYVTFSEVAKIAPTNINPQAVWRWARDGVLVRGTGERIYLKHVRIGRQCFTTRQWLEQFWAEQAEADVAARQARRDEPAPRSTKPRPRAAGNRRQAVDTANETLAARGY